jgi:predicted Zn-dependent protease
MKGETMNKAREFSKEILLIPLGKVLVDVLEEIAVALRKVYQVHVRIGRSEEPDTPSYSDERRQFIAEKLLALVASRKRDSLVAVLGVVDADMFAGEKNFVFGVHTVERISAVLALTRLREEFYKKPAKRELFLRRAVTEAIFQVGLALGVECHQKKCALQPTTGLWKLDEKPQSFCSDCQTQVEEKIFRVKRHEHAPRAVGGDDEMLGQGPEGEKTLLPKTGPDRPEPDDETEVPGQLAEPESPTPAEIDAIHPEATGPEEPLIADGPKPRS